MQKLQAQQPDGQTSEPAGAQPKGSFEKADPAAPAKTTEAPLQAAKKPPAKMVPPQQPAAAAIAAQDFERQLNGGCPQVARLISGALMERAQEQNGLHTQF